jgi:hypothetical protein
VKLFLLCQKNGFISARIKREFDDLNLKFYLLCLFVKYENAYLQTQLLTPMKNKVQYYSEHICIFVLMRLTNLKLLTKHLRRNRGNKLLELAVSNLIEDIESNDWKSLDELMKSTNDVF